MYHYVRIYDPSLPYFRFLDIDNFRKQLDYFRDNFGFVTKKEWLAAVEQKNIDNVKGKIILTFDDAMSCHWEFVFPELQKRNLWGLFYVPTQPYQTGEMLDVHKIHVLCGTFSGEDLLFCLQKHVTEDMVPDAKRREFRQNTYKKQFNYGGVTEFKRILNYFVNYDYRPYLISKVSDEFRVNYDEESFYVSADKLVEMEKFGNIIGSHTNTHPVMSKLSYADQKIEIIDSFKYLKNAGFSSPKTYCHPYGGFYSFNNSTVEILESEDVKFSFNVESRIISASEFTNSNQCLPRFDCNEFPHGKAC